VKSKNHIRDSVPRKIFLVVNLIFLCVLSFVCLMPVLNVLCLSLSSSAAANSNQVTFWPVDFNLESYKYILDNAKFGDAFAMSIKRVLIALPINMFLMIFTAYPMSKEPDEFPGRRIMIVFGCPGGKAFERREELGTIAGRNCVHSIITEEDYGEEDVNKICEEIAGHVRAAGGSCEIITDRVEAIKKAISLMDDDTILFLPGKGRETREKRGIEYIDTPSDADVVIEYMK